MSMEYRTPEGLSQALELLAKHGEDARVIAGGTAVVPMLKQRLLAPELLVSLARVGELEGLWLHAATDGSPAALRLGARLSHRQVETAELVRRHLPALADTYHQVASVRIRNAATVGGGLAHADPNQDPPVTLLALGASVQLRSEAGAREVPIEHFFTDYYESVRTPEELLTSVDVPIPPATSAAAYLKFLPRSADDYATVSAAAWIDLDPASGTCHECRIALGCVGPTPLRASAAEALLRGRAPEEALLRELAEAARAIADPIDDTRGSAQYKREMAGVFARRAVEAAWSAAARRGAAA